MNTKGMSLQDIARRIHTNVANNGPGEKLSLELTEQALRDLATVPKGYIRQGTEDFKLLGQLAMTADKCVVGSSPKVGLETCTTCGAEHEVGVHLWHPDFPAPCVVTQDFQFVGHTDKPTCEFYSTREAATKAKADKAKDKALKGGVPKADGITHEPVQIEFGKRAIPHQTSVARKPGSCD